jgi:hypothetical protein
MNLKNSIPVMSRIFLVTLICILALAGCTIKAKKFSLGYSTTGASIPTEAKTVSVQYFENMARMVEAGLSQKVTDELKDYIQSHSPLILVTGTGDIDFEGQITTYETNKPVAITSGDQAAKNRFTIGIKVTFTCAVKPELNFESSFSRYEDYPSDQDFESESVKGQLTEDILKLLIEDIYNRAFVNW